MKVILPAWPVEGDPVCNRPWAVGRYAGPPRPKPRSMSEALQGKFSMTKYRCCLPTGHSGPCRDESGVETQEDNFMGGETNQ